MNQSKHKLLNIENTINNKQEDPQQVINLIEDSFKFGNENLKSNKNDNNNNNLRVAEN